MRCSMCAYEFETTELACHSGCPLGAGCMVICCPRCGYSTVDPARSGLTRWVQGFLGRKRRAHGVMEDGRMSLLDMAPGQVAEVADVGGDNERLLQLSQYGLLPGTPVRLMQKRPVAIVQVGHTDLALEPSVAAGITVESCEPRPVPVRGPLVPTP